MAWPEGLFPSTGACAAASAAKPAVKRAKMEKSLVYILAGLVLRNAAINRDQLPKRARVVVYRNEWLDWKMRSRQYFNASEKSG